MGASTVADDGSGVRSGGLRSHAAAAAGSAAVAGSAPRRRISSRINAMWTQARELLTVCSHAREPGREYLERQRRRR